MEESHRIYKMNLNEPNYLNMNIKFYILLIYQSINSMNLYLITKNIILSKTI